MGFLDLYSGTTKVDVGGGFHIEIKNYLSNADYNEAQSALLKDQRVDTTGVSAKVDTAAYTMALVKKAIVGWNLTDAQDQVIPVNDATIAMLPQVVFNQVHQAIEANEKEKTPAEQAEFSVTG